MVDDTAILESVQRKVDSIHSELLKDDPLNALACKNSQGMCVEVVFTQRSFVGITPSVVALAKFTQSVIHDA